MQSNHWAHENRLQSFENPQQLESQDTKVIGQIGQLHEMPGGPQGI
jgi:hypothetical protein